MQNLAIVGFLQAEGLIHFLRLAFSKHNLVRIVCVFSTIIHVCQITVSACHLRYNYEIRYLGAFTFLKNVSIILYLNRPLQYVVTAVFKNIELRAERH
jgi:hypothetical protein